MRLDFFKENWTRDGMSITAHTKYSLCKVGKWEVGSKEKSHCEITEYQNPTSFTVLLQMRGNLRPRTRGYFGYIMRKQPKNTWRMAEVPSEPRDKQAQILVKPNQNNRTFWPAEYDQVRVVFSRHVTQWYARNFKECKLQGLQATLRIIYAVHQPADNTGNTVCFIRDDTQSIMGIVTRYLDDALQRAFCNKRLLMSERPKRDKISAKKRFRDFSLL